MKPSSLKPTLHLVYSTIGAKGLNNLGNKQLSLNFSKMFDLILEISEVIFEKRFDIVEYIVVRGEIFFCTRFSVSPTRMTGRGHECCSRLFSDCLEIGEIFGSEKSTAVAGMIRGIKNDRARADENTDSTVAPLRPPTRPPTSPATMGFWKDT